MKKLVLIDGHSILNRAFFGIPDLTNSEGMHTNAVYGFLNIMFKILDEEQPDYLTVAFDVSVPTFRHKMYAEYKGNRKPMQPELREQVPVIKEVLCAMGIKTVEQPGYEADDILGTISRQAEEAGMEVAVISGDRDLLQLATEKVKIRIPKTKRGGTEIEDYLAGDVLKRYQVTPTEFIDVKALMGDSSDNIPGVPGIGEKGATAIIVKYKNIENAHDHVDEITPTRAKNALAEHYDMAVMSKALATIDTHAEIDYDLDSAAVGDFYTPEAYVWFKRLEFKQMLTRFEDKGTGAKNVEECFATASDMDEFFDMASGFAKGGGADGKHGRDCRRVSVVFLKEGETVYGVAVAGVHMGADETDDAEKPDSDGGLRVAYFPIGDDFTLMQVEERMQVFCDGCDLIISPDLKSLMKHCPIKKGHGADVGIAAYLLNPLKNDYSYDDMAKDYLGEMIPARADLLGKLKLAKAAAEQPEAVARLASYMAYTALKAHDPLMESLKEAGMYGLYTDMELPLVWVLDDMEVEGVCVDADALIAYGRELSGRMAELEAGIYEKAGEKFNINSPKQLGVILFEKLQMKGGKKTKTGYSTAADVLEKLAPDHPIVSEILEYRQLAKLKSTYAEGLAACIDIDGRIHTTFNQTIAATGRLSSTEPNLQNIPIRMEMGKLFRKVFIPKPGCVFIDADYSQIELRVLAHMSEDENLINAYRHAEDIHRITASQVFAVAPEDVTPLMRRNAKAVNFGIVYGISSFGLSQDLSISRKEAEEYIANYFATFPGIKAYLDQAVKDARERGYAVTLYGRRRPVPELSSGNFMQRQFGERIAMNSPIQGTAADIIKIAMIRVHDRLAAEGLESKLILQVHDELLVEAVEAEAGRVKEILYEEMRGAANLAVDLEVDVQQGENWLEAH